VSESNEESDPRAESDADHAPSEAEPKARGGSRTECPFCKESILTGAVMCRYCGSRLAASEPSHGGTCPMCKETINPGAVKCRYCRSVLLQQPLLSGALSGCRGCGGPEQSGASMGGAQTRAATSGCGCCGQANPIQVPRARMETRPLGQGSNQTYYSPGQTYYSPGQTYYSPGPTGGANSPVSMRRLGGGGGLPTHGGPGEIFGAWGCWQSECCDCIRYERVDNGTASWDVCAEWSCYPCERCVWPW
jgi:hypothetical protein